MLKKEREYFRWSPAAHAGRLLYDSWETSDAPLEQRFEMTTMIDFGGHGLMALFMHVCYVQTEEKQSQ